MLDESPFPIYSPPPPPAVPKDMLYRVWGRWGLEVWVHGKRLGVLGVLLCPWGRTGRECTSGYWPISRNRVNLAWGQREGGLAPGQECVYNVGLVALMVVLLIETAHVCLASDRPLDCLCVNI